MKSGPASHNPQKSRLRSLAPAGLPALLAVVALSVADLYGMSGLPGTQASASKGGSCEATAAKLPRIVAASQGEVAAFNALKTPRPLVDLSFQGPNGAPKKLSDLRG